MTLASRQTLERVTGLIADLGTYASDGYGENDLQARYFSIVTQLRSVGHILHKTDCSEEPLKSQLSSLWERWKSDDVFIDFIERTRNYLLKESDEGLRLRGDPNVHISISADPGKPGGATTWVHVEPSHLLDVEGRPVMPLLRRSITFWDRCLREVESIRQV